MIPWLEDTDSFKLDDLDDPDVEDPTVTDSPNTATSTAASWADTPLSKTMDRWHGC